MCSLFFTGDVEAVALEELDSASDACKNDILPFGEPLCAAAVDDDRASTDDEHAAAAAAALDGPSPRCSPHSSPLPLPAAGLPTYDVMAAASAVWKPGSDVIALAMVSVSTIGATLPVLPPLNWAAICCTCAGWQSDPVEPCCLPLMPLNAASNELLPAPMYGAPDEDP